MAKTSLSTCGGCGRRWGDPLTILGDRNQIHGRSKAVEAYVAKHPEVVTEDFPACTPELNPNERGVRLGKARAAAEPGGGEHRGVPRPPDRPRPVGFAHRRDHAGPVDISAAMTGVY
jgi:hypothetical protein